MSFLSVNFGAVVFYQTFLELSNQYKETWNELVWNQNLFTNSKEIQKIKSIFSATTLLGMPSIKSTVSLAVRLLLFLFNLVVWFFLCGARSIICISGTVKTKCHSLKFAIRRNWCNFFNGIFELVVFSSCKIYT